MTEPGKAGDAFIQITPSAEGLQEKVTEEVDKIDAKIEAPIEPKLDEAAVEEENAKLDELARDREAHIGVDTTELDAEIQKCLDRIDYLDNRIEAKSMLGLDTDYADAQLAEVEARLEQLQAQRQVMLSATQADATVEQIGAALDDAAQARVQLGQGDAPEVAAAIHAELQRAATAEVQLDTSRASAELAALAAEKDLTLGTTGAAAVAPTSELFSPIFGAEPAAAPTGPVFGPPLPPTGPVLGPVAPPAYSSAEFAPVVDAAAGVGALAPAAEQATAALDLTGLSVEELGTKLAETEARAETMRGQLEQLAKLSPPIRPVILGQQFQDALVEAQQLREALLAARDAEAALGAAAHDAEREVLSSGNTALDVANRLGSAFHNPDTYATQATKTLDNALARVQGLGTGGGITDVVDENIAPAEAKLGILRAQLEALRHYLITPEMDTATFEAQLGLIRAELAALSRGEAFNLGQNEPLGIGPLLAETTGQTFPGDVVDTRARFDATAAEADLAKYEAQLAAIPPEKTTVVKTVSDGGGAAAAGSGGGGFMAGALALSPALIPLGAVGLADLGALTNLFPLAIAGTASLKLGFEGVQAAITAADKYAIVPSAANLHALQIAMDKLSPAGKAFIDFYEKTLHPALRGFIADAQTPILGGLTDGLKASEPAWKMFGQLISTVSHEIGDMFRGAGTYLAGPEFKQFLQFVITEAPGALRTFSSIVGNIFRGFEGLTQAFGPWTATLGGWIEGLTVKFRNFGLSAGNGTNAGFAGFMAYVFKVAPTVQDFFHQLWVLIGNITQALSGVGFTTLGEITGLLHAINAIPQPVLTAMIEMWVIWKQITWVNNLLTGAGAIGTMLTKLQGIKAIGGLAGVLGGALIAGVVVIAAMGIISQNQGRFANDPTGINPGTKPADPLSASDYMQQGNAGLTSFFGAIGQLFGGNYSGPGGLADWSNKQRDLLNRQLGNLPNSPAGRALGAAQANQAQPAPAAVTGRFGATSTTAPDNRGSRSSGGAIPTGTRGGAGSASTGGTFPAAGSSGSWWDRLLGGNLFTGPGSISDQVTKGLAGISRQWNAFWGGLPGWWDTHVAKPLSKGWDDFWGGLGKRLSTWSGTISRQWNQLWGGLGSWWHDHVSGPISKGWDDFWSALGKKLSTWSGTISRQWNQFWGGIPGWWHDHVSGPVSKGWDDFWSGLGKKLSTWSGTVSRQWDQFWGGLPGWWHDHVSGPISKGWDDFWSGLGKKLSTWSAGVSRQWNDFWGGIPGWWDTHVAKPISKGWDDFWSGLGKKLSTWSAGVGKQWNDFWTGVGNWFRDKVVTPISKGWDDFWSGLGKKIDTLGPTIAKKWGDFWNGLKGAISVPINWVIDNPVNNGVIKAMNWVGGLFGAKPIGNVPDVAFATGGRVPGTGTGDTVAARLTPGEFVVPTSMVPVLGGHGVLEGIRAAVTGRPAGGTRGRFADGGTVGTPPPSGGGIGALIGDAGAFIAKAISDPGGAVRSLFGGMMTVPGSNGWVTQIAGAPVTLLNDTIKAVGDKVKSMLSSAFGVFTGAPAGGPQVTAWITQALALMGLPMTYLPGISHIIQMESGGNPNAINLTDSNAVAGHPSQGLMQTIPSTFARWVLPALAGLGITNPIANITAGVRYALATYGPGMILAGGRSSGGKYVGYDEGGMLPPGAHTVVNQTGVPERILSAGQSASFDRLVHHITGRPGAIGRSGAEYHFHETGWDVDRIMKEAERRERLLERSHP